MPEYRSASGSAAEDLFIDLFANTFGAEKAGYLYSQYPFYDIYQNARFADFVLENGETRVAIEIDDEASHNPRLVSQDKFYDDLLKQNSMIHLGVDVYRWAVRQMQKQPETVKDELRVFLGSDPRFKEIEDYLPTRQGRALKADQLELREYQQEALDSLQAMRQNRETIALLYHATGTGKTVTAVMDAKRCGGRVLFVAHNGAGEPGLQHLPRSVAGSDGRQVRRQSQRTGRPCGVRQHPERGAESGSVPGGHFRLTVWFLPLFVSPYILFLEKTSVFLYPRFFGATVVAAGHAAIHAQG